MSFVRSLGYRSRIPTPPHLKYNTTLMETKAKANDNIKQQRNVHAPFMHVAPALTSEP